MKGKIAFVLGAAVGYVLGTRAGRARYEQIKRGAAAVWQTAPVQKGVGAVRGVIDERINDAKAFAMRATSDAFANLAKQTSSTQNARAADATSVPQDGATTTSAASSAPTKDATL